jgi:quinol monooxygenase YgiN
MITFSRRGAMLLASAFVALAPAAARAQAPAAPPAAAAPQTYEGPAHVIFYVEAKAGAVDKTIALLKRYRAALRKDAAIRGTQLIQELGRPNRLALIASWSDQPAFEAHEKGPVMTALRQDLESLAIAPPDRRLHHDFLVGSLKPPPKGAIFALVHIDVNPPNRVATDAILKQLVADSRKDSGNLGYDVWWQNLTNLNHYGSVSIWRDRKAFESYERQSHTEAARKAVQPLLGALWDERLYRILD